jgi:DNA-directed RNA polymerase subunit alpha
MDKIGLPKIEETVLDDHSSKFVIEPLYPGYGPTIGNALRRVLLSSIVGSAATYFRVEGINHEFSAIPGVKEDMIELLLNLKGINFKSYSDEPVTLRLSKKGPSSISAADFEPNDQIEIGNPDFHIASIDRGANLQLELIVEKDRGFRPTGGQEDKREIGWIGIDASFSPVKRVSFSVENTRVGQMTNFDKITMEVTTDGTVKPIDALKEAGRVLVDHFEAIISDSTFRPELTERVAEKNENESLIEEEQSEEKDSLAEGKMKIEDTGISQRTANALLNAGIKTVAGLKRLSPLKIEEIKGLGKKGMAEVRDIITKYE